MYHLFNFLDEITPNKQNIQIVIKNGFYYISGKPHSHIGKYAIKVEQLSQSEFDILVQLLINNGVFQSIENLSDFEGRITNTKGIRLKTKNGIFAKRGFGLELDRNGNVNIAADKWKAQEDFEDLENVITDAITTAKMVSSMQEMNYEVDVNYDEEEKAFLMVGVQYD